MQMFHKLLPSPKPPLDAATPCRNEAEAFVLHLNAAKNDALSDNERKRVPPPLQWDELQQCATARRDRLVVKLVH